MKRDRVSAMSQKAAIPRHIHEAGEEILDECRRCGRDIRDPIHLSMAEISPPRLDLPQDCTSSPQPAEVADKRLERQPPWRWPDGTEVRKVWNAEQAEWFGIAKVGAAIFHATDSNSIRCEHKLTDQYKSWKLAQESAKAPGE